MLDKEYVVAVNALTDAFYVLRFIIMLEKKKYVVAFNALTGAVYVLRFIIMLDVFNALTSTFYVLRFICCLLSMPLRLLSMSFRVPSISLGSYTQRNTTR